MNIEAIKQTINQLDAFSCIEILHECAERLGMVSVEQATEILCIKKRTLYEQIKRRKVVSLDIDGKIYVCINN